MNIRVSGKRDKQFPHLLKLNVIWQDQKLICRLYIIAYCSKGKYFSTVKSEVTKGIHPVKSDVRNI